MTFEGKKFTNLLVALRVIKTINTIILINFKDQYHFGISTDSH